MSLKNIVRMARMNSRITPKLQGWLVNHPDGVHITKKAIAVRAMQILKPKIIKSRAGAFHPSQLYQCKRAQVYGYHNAPTTKVFNPQLQNIFNDGHFRHLRWQIMLLEAGLIQEIEVPVDVPEIRLQGSMDGVNTIDKWMFELKGTSQYSTIVKKGVMPAHIKQIHAYLLGSGLDEAIVVYECKSTQQWHESVVHKDPDVINEISTILESLNDAIDNEYLPERLPDCENKTGATYNSCAFAEICHGCNKPSDIVALLQNK